MPRIALTGSSAIPWVAARRQAILDTVYASYAGSSANSMLRR